MLYIFILLILITLLSFLVVFSKNTIVSMLSLIGCFILTSFCFFLLQATFLAFTLLIVYGSAISILFLFIIMLLNLRVIDVYYIHFNYTPFLYILVCFYVYICNIILLQGDTFNYIFYNTLILEDFNSNTFSWLNFFYLLQYNHNLSVFGIVLYNNLSLFVILSGLILLIAMFGAISLVLHDSSNINHNNVKYNYILKNYKKKY